MAKWELRFTLNWSEAELWASDGWELVSVVLKDGGLHYFFKKEKKK